MKYLKKYGRIFALILLSNIMLLCNASVAYPGLINFKQPDGSIVKIKLRGDENLKWAETEDGYTLLYGKAGSMVYARLDDKGDLVPTDIVAADIAKRTADVQRRLEATPKKLFYSESQRSILRQIRQARTAQQSVGGPLKAVTGSKKMLVILVDYPDCSFKKTKADFNNLFNQLNYTEGGRQGSVRDFYKENSFGQFDLTADIVGVYRLSNNRAYYGANTTSGANDIRPQQMAEEAMRAANGDVNYANYSVIHIIYAGRGEESGGGSDCIWAHSWTVNLTLDGKRISTYSCSPELRASADPYDTNTYITHIGVICHEVAHALGTQDFYDTDGTTNGSFDGTGMWDIMADGEWLAGGACPAHFNPYTKIYDFGWASPTVVSGRSQYKLYAKSQNGFVRINTSTSNEYFLLEYRVQTGFDRELPGHGLMIYRASEGLSKHGSNMINAGHKQQFYPVSANAKYALPNSDPSSYGVINSYTAPFPGNNGVDEFTDASVPSMKSWNGVNTNLPITSIDEYMSEGYVMFDVAAPFTYSSITPTPGTAESLNAITIKFPKAAHINSSAGGITLKSGNSSYYATNISVSMSSDGKTATISSTPNNSRWVIGQTYTLNIPAGYFVADSNNRSYETVSCSWTIVPETFTYSSVSPESGELQHIGDILISFPTDFRATNGGSMPTLNIVDANGRVVRTVATYKTKDINDNPALMAKVSPAISELGNYRLKFPAGILSNDQYGSMLNRAFEIEWDVVLPSVQAVSIYPYGSEAINLNTITISFNEKVRVNANAAEKISITSDDPNNYGKDIIVSLSSDGLKAAITSSPTYGDGWTIGKRYTLNVPGGYFIGESGGTNKAINHSWTIVPERLLPTEVLPAEGEISSLSEIIIKFPGTIYTNGNIRAANIVDENGNVVFTTSPYRSNNSIVATVNPPIENPGTYTFMLPAGQVSNNIYFYEGLQNGDIRLTWTVKSILATSVTLDKTDLNMQINEIVTLVATVLPQTTANKTLHWISSDESVAIVDQNGVVTAVGYGETVISAMTTDGSNLSDSCRVNVNPIVAESLTLDKSEMTMRANDKAVLVATIMPESAINKTIVWTSSDDSVAIVNQNGEVTAVSGGVAIITATVEGTDIKDTCKVGVITTLGDANNDDLFTITDIVVVASYMLGEDIQGFVPASADINNDDKVDETDIALLVNLVLSSTSQTSQSPFKAPQYSNGGNRLYIDDFIIDAGETKQIAIKFDNVDAFTAFQADIRLPEGIELCNDSGDFVMTLSERKGNDHVLNSALRNDGAIRLLSYSLGLNDYSGYDGELIYLAVRASEDFAGADQIILDNVLFVEANREEHSFTPTSTEVIGGVVTGLVDAKIDLVTTSGNDIILSNVPQGAEVKVYMADGALIRSEKSVGDIIRIEAPNKGVYIVKVGMQTVKVII